MSCIGRLWWIGGSGCVKVFSTLIAHVYCKLKTAVIFVESAICLTKLYRAWKIIRQQLKIHSRKHLVPYLLYCGQGCSALQFFLVEVICK
jgi:hypothetical protein